jgi:group I intron endonuclease
MGYVYVLEFPNGKRYVGATIETNIKRRWGGGCNYSGCKVGDAIKDMGWSNINKYYWEVPDSQLDEMERFLIQLYKSNEPEYGYNSQSGGKKGFSQIVTDEQRAKISESLKGENSYMYGKPKSEESKEKNRLAHIGKQPSDEARRKMSEAQRLRWKKRKD